MTRDRMPPARPGIRRFLILVIPFGSEEMVAPLLPQIAGALDLRRIRRDWGVSDYLTRDTLHVTPAPLENLQSAGFGRHCVTLKNALLEMKRINQNDA